MCLKYENSIYKSGYLIYDWLCIYNISYLSNNVSFVGLWSQFIHLSLFVFLYLSLQLRWHNVVQLKLSFVWIHEFE